MKVRSRKVRGFTLIEVLVVVAIIALLIAILLPSLQAARRHAKSAVCLSNCKHIGQAVADYLFLSKGIYPPSYVYPEDAEGNWTPLSQSPSHPFGYLHWSHFLYDDGKIGERAFMCPDFENGGAPRTNPGRRPEDWSGGQVDQNGDSRPNDLIDRQAPRMAYGASAVIMPRNKFTTVLSQGARINRLVPENEVTRPGDTIMATEYLNNWKAIGVVEGGGVLSKSHRPINPFYHIGGGYNEYAAPPRNPGFMYGIPEDQKTYGLLPEIEVRDKVNILDHTSGIAQINAIGRHHPTANKVYRRKYGGSTNFLFCDGHAEAMTILDSVHNRKWGDAYYSLNGETKILNMSHVETDD